MTAVRLGTTTAMTPQRARRALFLVFAGAAFLTFLIFRDQWTLPHDDDSPLFRALNGVRDFVDQNRTVLDPVRAGITGLIDFFDLVIASLGWPGIIGVAAALGMLFSGWRVTIIVVAGFLALGAIGLWDESMATLSLILAAVVIAIAIGLPLGILAGRSDRVSAFLSPFLDVMQIMPTMAYLTPMTLLFLIGAAPSTIATLIYAIPPAIRITTLGIRGVPKTTVEAAEALGSTDAQVLRKVQLPLARRAIGLGINQTIMLALSMVVVTGLIGAPGLGRSLTTALSHHDVGAAFEVGLAIVILAVILDRLTFAAGEWLDPRIRRAQVRAGGRLVTVVLPIVFVAAGLLAPAVVDATQFPDAISFSISEPVDTIATWITDTFSPITVPIKNVLTTVILNPLETFLTTSPWWLVIAMTALIAWFVSGRRPAITATVCLSLVVLLGLWEHSMTTLANVLLGTALTLLIGVAIGVQSARHDGVRTALRPILDIAQTMPAFVYLIPALALFQPGRFTAIVAAIIFAVPPVIRLVDIGIRQVPATVVEAARASGATERQLLWKVQLPMAKNTLLLAANQGIIMVLGMVVIGALVGAGALGFDVITGFAQGEDFGKGLAAGIAIVLLGIMLDRITQGAGKRRRVTPARAG